MEDALRQPRLDPRLARRLAEKKVRLDAHRPLPRALVRRLHEEFRIVLTYHSNAIEGNTLSLRETELVIEHGLTIGGHTLREHLEATNHADAYTALIGLADQTSSITAATICTLHRLVMDRLVDDAGQWRTGPVSIRGARHRPPPARDVPGLIHAWLAWIDGPGQQYPPVIGAAIAHHDFEAIHPFIDGNGRVGRLLLNLMLMRAGYAPALLLRAWRLSYLNALATADTGNYTPLVNLIGRAVERGLDVYLEACAAVPDEEYQTLAELAPLTGYRREHLGWLARQGRLDAVKRGGRWYSTVAAIERYRAEVEQGATPRGRPRRA
jgi:Fic family protein